MLWKHMVVWQVYSVEPKTLDCGLLFLCVFLHWGAAGVECVCVCVCGNALLLPSGRDLNSSVPRKHHIFLVIEHVGVQTTTIRSQTCLSKDLAKATRNSSRLAARFTIDSLCLRHQTAAPSARPIIRFPVQSASPRSQQAAPRLLQLCPSFIMCISTQMRPAWVICVKIPKITKYNLWESSWLSWLLNTAEPKATLLLRSLLSHMDNHIPQAPIH